MTGHIGSYRRYDTMVTGPQVGRPRLLCRRRRRRRPAAGVVVPAVALGAPRPLGPHRLGPGRIAASEIEAPNVSAIAVFTRLYAINLYNSHHI
jgi:hypothetical protein